MTIFVQFIIAFVLALISYMLAPKPKMPKPDPAADLESPKAEAGIPVPVIFGTITMKSPNCLWYGEKRIHTYKVDA